VGNQLQEEQDEQRRASRRTRGEKGWNFSASARWPRSRWARARVRPQEGQGIPVTARSGHKTSARGDVIQSKARRAAAGSRPAGPEPAAAANKNCSGSQL